MRVLYFSRSYTVHDHRFLEALSNTCHEIFFLRLEQNLTAGENRPIPSAIKQVYWPDATETGNIVDNLAFLVEAFSSIVAEVRPDIIHAGPVPTCGFIAAMANAHPLMVMSWGSDLLVDADRDQSWHYQTCFALDHSEMLVADCDEVVNKAQLLSEYPTDRIVQFPWGVDLDMFHPGADEAGLRRRFNIEGRFVLLSTRNWEESYGILPLLEGFHQAYLVNQELRLLLLGDGSLDSRIKSFISQNGLSRIVLTPGRIPSPQLAQYNRAADLYISDTFSDGSSISLLEAMASGLPVIATSRESNREWVKERQGGLLVEFGDTTGIRDAILQISSLGKAQCKKWGEHNLLIAQQRANWRKNFLKLLDGYTRIDHIYQMRRSELKE